MTSDSIDFDFRAAIEEKNRFASPFPRSADSPAEERAIDVATAKMLGLEASEKSLKNVRLLIVVEATNYRDYVSSLLMGQTKPHRPAQPVSRTDAHILNSASAWNQDAQAVAIFSGYSATAYSEVCPLGIRLMGSGVASEEALIGKSARQAKQNEKQMLRLVADFCPTHIVMNAPNYRLLGWANRNRISSVVLLHHWIEPPNHQQRKQLNSPHVEWVGTKDSDACELIANSGVMVDKLIPWAWPRPHLPAQQSPKQLDDQRDRLHLLYAGTLDRSSGVGDLLAAVSHLQQKGRPVTLQIVVEEATPPAELDELFERSQQLEITEAIKISFTESIEQLASQVRTADVAIIPGDLPGQDVGAELPILLQVAMAVCTPIVACDRADFSDHLSHGVNAMIFPAGNVKAMVHRIERLMSQPQLYAQLSAAGMAQPPMSVPAAWKELIERWLSASPTDRQWLRNYAFSSRQHQPPEVFAV